MEISVQHEADKQTAVITVKGDIDLYSSPQVRQTILDTLNGKTAKRVIVNLAAVRYVDSSGVASLVEGLQLSRKSQVRFVLCGLNKAPLQVLELTRLVKVFEIHDTLETALAA
jgi:anti-sigma B factor antagonist